MGIMRGESRGEAMHKEEKNKDVPEATPPAGLIEACQRTYAELLQANELTNRSGEEFTRLKEIFDLLFENFRREKPGSPAQVDILKELERLEAVMDGLVESYRKTHEATAALRNEYEEVESHMTLLNAPGSSEGIRKVERKEKPN
jgi:hypothetical protein